MPRVVRDTNLVTLVELVGNAHHCVGRRQRFVRWSVLTLTASEADNYTWSTGENTQSIEVYQWYTRCTAWTFAAMGTSDTLGFGTPLGNPEVSDDMVLEAPATVDLNANGENEVVRLPTGGNLCTRATTSRLR